MRQVTILNIAGLLEQNGFLVSSYIHSNNCFDMAAKKDGVLLLIKVFENIDATRPEQAAELKKLSSALNATELIVGEKTKAGPLADNVVYERYGIKCISQNSFDGFLNHELPDAWQFKGRTTVELDSEKLRKTRQSKGLSLADIAKKIDSTPKTVFGYEHGSNSPIETAKRLEKTLSTTLIKKIDLIRKNDAPYIFDKKISDPVFEKIAMLGLDLAFFEHAPFDAFSHPANSLLISHAMHSRDVKKKGLALKETKKVVDADTVIIAKDFGKKSTDNTAVVQVEELESFSKKKDFIETIREREKK